MTVTTFPERVAARAVEINVARVALSVLAFPFYLLGVLLGLLLVCGSWVLSAAQLGVEDARSRVRRGDT